jgi:hypothetical protein
MFESDESHRLTRAGVLAALSAVPIGAGLAVGGWLLQFLCIAAGALLWLWALALLFPCCRPRH